MRARAALTLASRTAGGSTSTDALLRDVLVLALGELRGPDIRSVLPDLLTDGDPDVARVATYIARRGQDRPAR